MVTTTPIDDRELTRYVRRIIDRWPLEGAYLGGARVEDEQGAPLQRERGPEYVVVLVSQHFDGIPWLERVHIAGSLWDGAEMGAPADVHCYTPAELQRKVAALPAVRRAVRDGRALLAA